MLKISFDGRNGALDMRSVDPEVRAVGVDGPTKVSAAAEMLHEVWLETRENRHLDPATGQVHPTTPGALQIVFCDLSSPGSGDGFDVYTELHPRSPQRPREAGAVPVLPQRQRGGAGRVDRQDGRRHDHPLLRSAWRRAFRPTHPRS